MQLRATEVAGLSREPVKVRAEYGADDPDKRPRVITDVLA